MVMVTFSIVPFALIRCKYQISNTFSSYLHSLNVLNLIQVVEPDKFTLTESTGFENGLFSLALGCWPAMIQPFGGRQGTARLGSFLKFGYWLSFPRA